MGAGDGKVVIVQGRIVWTSGDIFKGRVQTIFGTNQPKLDPKTGEQSFQFGFGLSIPTIDLADPNKAAGFWKALYEEAFSMYPTGQIPPSFAMKFKNGDTDIDENGKPYSLREGYAGCHVFAITSPNPPRFYRWEGGQNVQVADGIKCGDYVNVQVRIRAHPAITGGKAGLYLNPQMVQLVAPGKEIINASTGDQVFGLSAPQAPAGYVPPAAPSMPTMPPQPMAAPPIQPHYAVVPPSHQPMAPQGAYPPQPQAAPMMPQPQAYPAQPMMPPIPGR